MSRPFFSVLLFGYIAPALLALVIGVACVLEFGFLYSSLQNRLAIYNAIQQCRKELAALDEDLKKAEGEAKFLDTALPDLEERAQLGRLDDFLTYLKTSSGRGLQLTKDVDVTPAAFYGEGCRAKTLTVEGFSGPIIGVMGQGLRKCAPVFTDAWSIRALPDRGILEFNITVVYSPIGLSPAPALAPNSP
ncbi:MAG: hypothetical protein V1746_00425 [bacterium]